MGEQDDGREAARAASSLLPARGAECGAHGAGVVASAVKTAAAEALGNAVSGFFLR